MNKPLTATMVACIDDTLEAGGELVRFQGGFWATPGAHPTVDRRIYYGTPTANAIVARGYAEYTEHRERATGGSFPIRMRLIPEALAPHSTQRDDRG